MSFPKALEDVLLLNESDNDIFENNEQKQACKKMVDSLTEEELELAAQSSYAFWRVSLDKTQSNETRTRMAMREAKRYFIAARSNFDEAVKALKNTCGYRKEYRIDVLRSCFDPTTLTAIDKDLAAEYQEYILDETSIQRMAVVGSDKSDCAILHLGARECLKMSDQGYLMTQLLMVERALATTEVDSMGKEDRMVVVLDASSLKSKCAPSRQTLKELLYILQNHYPQRLKSLVVLDAPLWLRALYNVLSPFMDARTRGKFRLAKGKRGRTVILDEIIKADMAATNIEEVDMKHFLTRVPFQCGYTEEEMERLVDESMLLATEEKRSTTNGGLIKQCVNKG